MKKIIFILVFYCSLFITHYSLSQWVWQNSKPFGIPISDFFVFDANTVIAVGSPNMVIKTTNGGLTWNDYSIVSNKFYYCNNVYFINSNTGWISGSYQSYYNGPTFLIKTTNGGINWFSVFPYVSMQLVKFINENTGFIKSPLGLNGNATLLKTTDGGNNWVVLLYYGPYSNFLTGLDFIDENTGWLTVHTSAPYAESNNVRKTTDGGNSWTDYYPGFNSPSVYGIKFVNAQTGWLEGESGRIRKTTNGGINWFIQNVDTNYNGSFSNLFFFNENTGWVQRDSQIYRTTDGGSNWNHNWFIYHGAILKFVDINNFWTSENWNNTTFFKIAKSTNGGYNWTQLSSGIDYICDKISFSDPQNGWVIGQRSDYLKTTNGGDNWLLGQINIPNPRYTDQIDVHLSNSNTGWILYSDRIAKTTNSGNNWSIMYDTSLYSYFINFSFLNDSTCFVLTPHSILKTSNGGLNWYNQILNLGNFNLLTLRIFSGNNAWIIQHDYTNYYMLLKSTDGGLNWTANFWSLNQLNDVYFINSNTGWVTADTINNSAKPNMIYKTTNGGLNWIEYSHPDSIGASFQSVYFSDENSGYIVGSYYIHRTTNGGVNWVSRCIFSHTNTSLFFINGNTGWIGNGFSILKTTNGGITFANNHSSVITPEKFILYQNYPNPFNPTTKIHYEISKYGFVKLVVFDILGREIETLVNEKQNAGSYEAIFNASHYSSGVYFYRLITDNFSETKKMLLIK